MAGSTKILKENDILFKMGDPADCMYIVRKGALKVYFQKGAEEVQLALLNDGAIVGEMAFFDNKPRSAGVKALGPTEVTIITRADFDKLLQQVPKWMVTMMQSLSSRLRTTNEKLAALEAAQAGAGGALILPNQAFPFQTCLRVLRLIMLGLAKDGQKEGTAHSLPLETALRLWQDFAAKDETALFDKVVATLEKIKLVARKPDATKQLALAFPNRGAFVNFVEFFSSMAQKFSPLKPFLSDDALALFSAAVDQAAASGYETLNVGFETLRASKASEGVDVRGWVGALAELALIPDLKIAKSGNDLNLKILVKEHKLTAAYLRHIQCFRDAKLA